MLFMLASVGLPGTCGFVGEILVIIGVFQVNSWVAALAATGMILGAAYMLWLYRRVIFGALLQERSEADPGSSAARDRGLRAARLLVLLMGIYPALFLDPMAASVDQLLTRRARRPEPRRSLQRCSEAMIADAVRSRARVSRRSSSPAWRWRC